MVPFSELPKLKMQNYLQLSKNIINKIGNVKSANTFRWDFYFSIVNFLLQGLTQKIRKRLCGGTGIRSLLS